MSSLIKEDFVNTHTKNAIYVGSGGAILCILISLVLIITKYRSNILALFSIGVFIFSVILVISGGVYFGQLVYSNEDTKRKIKKSERAGFIAGGLVGGIIGMVVSYILMTKTTLR
jgi:hypothetical protein